MLASDPPDVDKRDSERAGSAGPGGTLLRPGYRRSRLSSFRGAKSSETPGEVGDALSERGPSARQCSFALVELDPLVPGTAGLIRGTDLRVDVVQGHLGDGGIFQSAGQLCS